MSLVWSISWADARYGRAHSSAVARILMVSKDPRRRDWFGRSALRTREGLPQHLARLPCLREKRGRNEHEAGNEHDERDPRLAAQAGQQRKLARDQQPESDEDRRRRM